MGEVYLADDPRLQRKVALKRLASFRVNSPEAREELRREARAAAGLNHPNIAVVYDVIDVEGQPYIVMEYVEGKTLLERQLEGPMDPHQVISIGRQLASALAEAHRHQIIHRDLKPSNILLTPAGKVKILDFGLARIEHFDESARTTAGRAMGTPAYMAPEQKLGYRADARSDIYAFALVLFEIATGRRPPHHGDGPLVLDEVSKTVPRASELNPSVPPDLSEVIARGMSWEPEERPQTAEEMEQALTSVERSMSDDDPTRTRYDVLSSRKTFRRRARRGPRLAGWSALAGAALAASLTGALFWNILKPATPGSSKMEDQPVVAVLPLVNVSGDPSMDHVGVGIAHTLITKLSAVRSVATISPSTVLRYGAGSHTTAELARDLGASYIVNGSVQRIEDTLLVTINLVRPDDSVAWGRELEGKAEDLFELQRRLSSGLAEALDLNLTPKQKRRLDTPPTQNLNAYAKYSQGRYFLEQGQGEKDLARGLGLLESAVELDGGFALAYAALAEGYWKQFERTTEEVWTEKARAAAERAQALDPEDPSTYYALAVIYRGTGESVRAMDALRRALDLRPNFDDAYRLMGQILAAEGDIAGAARELGEAIRLRPHFWGHHQALGLIYFRAGRFADAAAEFRRVTEMQPDLAVGYQSLGTAFHMVGDLDRAVPNYEKAIELSPSPASLNNLGTLYYRQGHFSAAARSYEKALELQPSRAVTHRNLGDAYRRLGNADGARAAYRQAAELRRNLLRVNPRDAPTLAGLALLQAKLGELSEATQLAARAVEIAPENPEVLYQNAVVHVFCGRNDEAIDGLRSAVAHGFGINELREDDDLDVLRGRPDFRMLLAGSDER